MHSLIGPQFNYAELSSISLIELDTDVLVVISKNLILFRPLSIIESIC